MLGNFLRSVKVSSDEVRVTALGNETNSIFTKTRIISRRNTLTEVARVPDTVLDTVATVPDTVLATVARVTDTLATVVVVKALAAGWLRRHGYDP